MKLLNSLPLNRCLISFLLGSVVCLSASPVFANVVENGKRVTLDYVLSINSEPMESTQGKEPLTFVVGSQSVIPGLEAQLMGMTVGQEKKIIIDAKDAYGPIEEKAFKEVPLSALPPGTELKPGLVVEADDPQGGAFPGVVWEVKTDSVVINFNHPLAGQTLEFDVKVREIQ